MSKDTKVREGLVIKPFEARIASNELKARVIFFQKYLKQKSNKPKFTMRRISKNITH